MEHATLCGTTSSVHILSRPYCTYRLGQAKVMSKDKFLLYLLIAFWSCSGSVIVVTRQLAK